MSALDEAERALSTAQDRAHSTAQDAAIAKADAAKLRDAVVSGAGSNVTAEVLAAADHKAEHAALIAQGTGAALPGLSAAVQAAVSEEVADEIVTTLPQLGTELTEALYGLADQFQTVIAAASKYDGFVAQSVRRLNTTTVPNSARVKIGRHSAPSVDRISVAGSRTWAHIAALAAPAFAATGAPEFTTQSLKDLSASAPTIPTI
jgi:hypothetical protein